jgi:hypothetical protein
MAKRSIKIQDLVDDVRSGLTYLDLLKKYQLSSKQFQKVFEELLKRSSLNHGDLLSSIPAIELEECRDDGFFDCNTRRTSRDKVDFPLPVYDIEDMYTKGEILDISDRGIQIKGIKAYEGDLKTLVIPEHEPFVVDSIEFDAICRWVKRKLTDQEYITGFEVLSFSQGSLADILALIRFVSGQIKAHDSD